ncbi:MAG: autotransporter domain-containing protein [Gammaproteobacteria bacterium]|nr:autotransporter domain-containing protein [Gammaproteobacteria bacterium]
MDDLNEPDETVIFTLSAPGAGGYATVGNTNNDNTGGNIGLTTTTADQSATATITDDDDLTLSVALAASTTSVNVDQDDMDTGLQVNEGTSVVLTVTLSGRSQGDVAVGWSAAIGTQTNTAATSTPGSGNRGRNEDDNADINAAGATISMMGGMLDGAMVMIPSGQTTADITIQILQDAREEDDETVTVTLDATEVTADRGVTAPSATASFEINDNPAATRFLAITVDEASREEGQSAVFTVTLSGSAYDDGAPAQTVDWCITGTAESNDYSVTGAGAADCSGVSGTVLAMGRLDFGTSFGGTMAPAHTGGLTRTVRTTITNDNLNEASETLTLTLSNIQGGSCDITADPTNCQPPTVANVESQTVTIAASDPTVYSITGNPRVRENAANAALAFTIRLTNPSEGDITIPYTLGGTATGGGTDYTTPAPLNVTVDAGETTASLSISIADDDLNEVDETVTVALGTPVTVVSEGSNNGGAASSVTRDADENDQRKTGTIDDEDDIRVTIVAAMSSDTDNAAAGIQVSEGNDATFTVTLDHESTAAVTVPYSVSGVSADDYTDEGGGTLNIAAGMTTGSIVIGVTPDILAESAETLRVNLRSGSGLTAAGAIQIGNPGNAAVTIPENEAAVHIVSVATSATAVEEDAASVTFTLSLPNPAGANARVSGDTVTVTYTLTGTATGGAATVPSRDYTTPSALSAEFSDDAVTQTVTVNLNDDNINESAETIVLTLVSVSHMSTDTVGDGAVTGGVAVGSGNDRTATATIAASDPVTYSIADATAVTEGDTMLAYTVTLAGASGASGGSDGAITIPYTLSGTATVGRDYRTPSPRSVTIAAGMTTADITISVTEDPVNEANETVIITLGDTPAIGDGGGMVTLSDASGAAAGTGTINDDDAAEVAAADLEGMVNEGADMVFTFTLNINSEQTVQVPWTAAVAQSQAPNEDANDLATSSHEFRDGPDVTVTPDALTATGTVTFNPGQRRRTLRLPINRDGLGEDDEVVTVTIGTITARGVTAPDTTAMGTIAGNAGVPYRFSVNAPADVAEDGASAVNAEFTISLSIKGLPAGSTRQAATVYYTFGGTAERVDPPSAQASTASAGRSVNDYQAPGNSNSGSLAFPADASDDMQTLTVPIVDDALNEGAESLTLRINRVEIGGRTARNEPGNFGARVIPDTGRVTGSGDTVQTNVEASDPLAVGIRLAPTLVPGEAASYTLDYGTTDVRDGAAGTPIVPTMPVVVTLEFQVGSGMTREVTRTLPAGDPAPVITLPVSTVNEIAAAMDFTSGDNTLTVTVMSASSTGAGDAAPSTASATATAGGGSVTQQLEPWRLELTNDPVARDGMPLRFRVRLAGRLPAADVSVSYSVANGGDHPRFGDEVTAADDDFCIAAIANDGACSDTIASNMRTGTVTLPRGRRTVDIVVNTAAKDDMDAARESLTVTLTATSTDVTNDRLGLGNQLARVGVISDDDPDARSRRMKTKLAVIGRASAVLAGSLIEKRVGALDSANPQASLTIGGKRVSTAGEDDFAAATGDWAANPFEREQMMADTRSVSGGEALTSSDIVRRTSFNLIGGGPGGATLWGGAGTINFDGDDAMLDYDGDVKAYHVGMESRSGGQTVFGMSVGHSGADLDFTDSEAEVSGRMKSNMVSMHPYAIRRFAPGVHGWLTVGFGKSDVDITETATSRGSSRTETVATRMQTWMASAGFRGRREIGLNRDVSGKFTFDGSNSTLDAATFPSQNELRKTTATTVRLGNEWEFGYTYPLSSRSGALRLFALGGLRKDFSDAKQDAALDLGGGLEVHTDGGFSVRIRGATQVNNTAQDEDSLSMDIGLDPSNGGFGLNPFTRMSMDDEGRNTIATGIRYRLGSLSMTVQTTLSDNAAADYGNLVSGEWRF